VRAQVDGISRIDANDMDEAAVAAIRRNAAHNGGAAAALVRPMQGDARLVMYQARALTRTLVMYQARAAARGSGWPACMQGRPRLLPQTCAERAPDALACTRPHPRRRRRRGLARPSGAPRAPASLACVAGPMPDLAGACCCKGCLTLQ